jgi:undecaprenyl-diphosphatase
LFVSDSCKRWTLVFWAGLGSGAALMGLIKVLTMRPRPSPPFAEVLYEYPGFSFPSGHVIFFVQYFGFLYVLIRSHSNNLLLRRVALILMGLPVLLVGCSRIYTGAHWPSDVLGGYLLGGVLLALMVQSSRE